MNIPLSKPYMDEEIKGGIVKVLESGNYILGENSARLEVGFAKYIGTKHAVLTSSGTSALMLSLIAMGIGKGDEVITTPHTAFPTIEAIFHAGARPVFADIEQDTYTLDPSGIEDRITKKTRAILPVHIYGHPCDMEPIQDIAEKHGLLILEDCCQAHGAEFRGKKVGSMGDAGCFSFYPSKNMTVGGDGGLVATDRDDIAERVRMLRDHGRKGKYEHELIGWNLRFNEIQAAVGLVQLKHLDGFDESRRGNAQTYNSLLRDLPLTLPQEREWARHVYHLYVIRTEKREGLQEFLKQNGIGAGIHYPVPCHLQPAIRGEFSSPPMPNTEKIVNEILSLPMFPGLKREEIEYICGKIRGFI